MFAPGSYEATLTTVTPIAPDEYAYVVTVQWEWDEARYVVSTAVDLSTLPYGEIMNMIRSLAPRDEGGHVIELHAL